MATKTTKTMTTGEAYRLAASACGRGERGLAGIAREIREIQGGIAALKAEGEAFNAAPSEAADAALQGARRALGRWGGLAAAQARLERLCAAREAIKADRAAKAAAADRAASARREEEALIGLIGRKAALASPGDVARAKADRAAEDRREADLAALAAEEARIERAEAEKEAARKAASGLEAALCRLSQKWGPAHA